MLQTYALLFSFTMSVLSKMDDCRIGMKLRTGFRIRYYLFKATSSSTLKNLSSSKQPASGGEYIIKSIVRYLYFNHLNFLTVYF